jgi:hypothetical protein
MLELIRERYRGTLIIAGGFDHDTAEGWLQQGKADLIAFGRMSQTSCPRCQFTLWLTVSSIRDTASSNQATPPAALVSRDGESAMSTQSDRTSTRPSRVMSIALTLSGARAPRSSAS